MLKNIQRRKRKIIAMVLSVLLVAAVGVGFCYNSNHAEAMIYKDEGQQIVWSYELDGDGNAINVRISGAATEVVYGSSSITTDITVPDAIAGHKVVSIGEANTTGEDTFFVGCDVGPSITVDTTGCTALTTVNQYAFYDAAYMTIKLAPTITNIGENVFCDASKSTAKTISPNIIFAGEDSSGSSFKFSAPNQSTAYERYAPLNKYTDNGLQAIKILLDKNDTKAKTGEGLFYQYIYVLTDGSNKDVSKIIIPTKDHYRFLGYFTQEEGGSMVYNENGELQTVEGLQDNDTLYAHWEANTYTITYHADEDVTGSMDKQIVSYDSEFNFSEVGFKKAGYTFAGWAKSKNGTIAYSDFTKTYQNITEEDNIDLYAMWKANTYTFAFNSNGGSGVMYNQTLTYDEDPVALTENAFVKTGYTFMGWSTEKDGEVVYSDKEQLQNEVTESKTIILYAVWKEHTYTITFLSEFVKTNINPVTAGYAEKVKLPPCKATRNGYTFVGWSKTVHNQSLWFHDEDTVSSLTAEDKGNIELYAMWEANNYTVNFDGNGATFVPSQQSVIQTYDKLFRLREDYLKTGYKLMGWSTKKHSPFAYEDKDELDSLFYFKPDDSVENLAESGEVTLYAVWYEQQYAIEYFANQDNEYYTENGKWQTVYTYESGAELPILTSPGYEFLGWVDSSNNLVSRVKPRTTTGPISLFGKWQKEKKPITIRGDHIKEIYINGSDAGIKDGATIKTYEYESNILNIKIVTDDCHEISNAHLTVNKTGMWTIYTGNPAETIIMDFNDYKVPAGGLTLEVSTHGKTYGIEYDLCNGRFQEGYPTSYVYGEGTSLPKEVTRTGYTFLGWTDKDGTMIEEISKTQSGSIKLYAKWGKDTYGLNIDPNGGTINDAGYEVPTSYSYDSGEILLPTNVTRKGYTFLGWYSENDKCFVKYVDTAKTGNQHIYAKWSQNSLIASEIIEVEESGDERKVQLATKPRTESNHYYNQLSNIEKRIYTTLYDVYKFDMNTGVCNTESIKLVSGDKFTFNDLYDASVAFLYEHPECFWIRSFNWGTCDLIDGKYYANSNVVSAYSNPISYKSDALEYKGNFDAAIKAINAKGLSAYETTKRIHDYIIKYYFYRYESKILNSNTTNETKAVGYMLAHKEGCCESYAKLTKVLCDYYNVPCILVSSDDHMWNEIQIEGKWYLYDVTWDDAENKLSYNYFLKGSNSVNDEHHKITENAYIKLNNEGKFVPITEYGCLKAPQISKTDYKVPTPSNNTDTKQQITTTKTNTTASTTKTIGKVMYRISGKNATVVKATSKKVKSVTIQSKVKIGKKSYKVTSITKNAFKNCKKLSKVTIKSTTLTKVGKNAFKGVNKKAKIIVPKKKYKKYKKLIAKKSVGWKKTMKVKKTGRSKK